MSGFKLACTYLLDNNSTDGFYDVFMYTQDALQSNQEDDQGRIQMHHVSNQEETQIRVITGISTNSVCRCMVINHNITQTPTKKFRTTRHLKLPLCTCFRSRIKLQTTKWTSNISRTSSLTKPSGINDQTGVCEGMNSGLYY